MSDVPFQLPSGQVSRKPVKFTLRGVGQDTPEGRAAVERYQGAARQFYQQQTQNSSLTVTNYTRVSVELGPGCRITYTRNFDQESIELEVQAGGEESPEHPSKGDQFWDWALVELVIPNMANSTHAEMSAILSKSFHGSTVYANYNWNQNSNDNILRYADVAWREQIGPDTSVPTDIVSSLLVDLRKFNNASGLSVDLYGFMYPFSQAGIPTDSSWTYTITGSNLRAHRGRDASPYTAPYAVSNVTRGYGNLAVSTFPGIYDALIASFPELSAVPFVISSGGGSWNDGQWTMEPMWDGPSNPGGWWDSGFLNPANSDPNTYTAHFASTYSDTSTYWDPGTNFYRKTKVRQGVSGTAPDGTAWTSNSIPQTNADGHGGHTNWFLNMYDYVDYYVPNCDVTPQVNAQIRVTFLDKEPDATSFFSVHSTNFYLWEIAKLYPNRPHFSTLPDTALVPGQNYPSDDSLANHFGQPKLGTMHVNPSKRSGGFKFTRA